MKVLKIKKSWMVAHAHRIDAPFHLSDGVKTKLLIQNCPYEITTLGKESKELFKGNIHKRVYVESEEHGHPFLTASDMFKANLNNYKFISKKYSPHIKELALKKDWIVITRSGTIGKVLFTNEDYEDKIGTDDLIRINPAENKVKKGYLYAFLKSKIGYALLTQSGYGGVVKHIEPEQIINLSIPIIEKSKLEEINTLILKSVKLRSQANFFYRKAISEFENHLPIIEFQKTYKSNLNIIKNSNFRIDATSQPYIINEVYRSLEPNCILKSIDELSEDVFTPNIFKRIRVSNPDMGIPFLSGSDLNNSNPQFENYLSRKMKNINSYLLREGWIAIQDAGTIGYVSLISNYLDGVAATNNLVRIVPGSPNYNFYIYGFLHTRLGQSILKSFAFGSVQKHIDNNHIKEMKIPIFDSIYNDVSKYIEQMMKDQSDANYMEEKAIQIIETELNSWQN